jgi:hypothetical protein
MKVLRRIKFPKRKTCQRKYYSFEHNQYRDNMSELEEEIYAVTKGGNISCSQALVIAATLGITPKKVGAKLNEMNIKIVKCQLGCFS